MAEIYDFTLPFKAVKSYTVFTFKRFYGDYIVIGRENIPTGSPLIFAPNHINALMDALAVHAVIPPGIPLIFLARSDLFKNTRAAKLMNFMKMMPAFRMRDGIENLDKNNEIFERCVEVLDHNAALGIMPEGNQGAHHRLRPLVKGIFRIAFSAQQKYGAQPGVKIIPVGINLGDLVKSGKHIIISIGKPIEVEEYMKEYAANSVQATNEIRNRLREDLSNLSLDLASETYYDCLKTITRVANTSYLKELELPDTTFNRFLARQKIAERLVEVEKNDPERIAALDIKGAEYERNLKTLNLRDWVFEQLPFKSVSLIMQGLKLLCTFPFFLYGFLTNFLPYLSPLFLRKRVLKTKDSGFFSSLHFALGMLTFPLFYSLQTLLFYTLFPFPAWASIVFLVTQYPMGKGSLKWYNQAVKFIAKIRFRSLQRSQSNLLQRTIGLKREIIKLFLSQKGEPNVHLVSVETQKKEVQI